MYLQSFIRSILVQSSSSSDATVPNPTNHREAVAFRPLASSNIVEFALRSMQELRTVSPSRLCFQVICLTMRFLNCVVLNEHLRLRDRFLYSRKCNAIGHILLVHIFVIFKLYHTLSSFHTNNYGAISNHHGIMQFLWLIYQSTWEK